MALNWWDICCKKEINEICVYASASWDTGKVAVAAAGIAPGVVVYI